MNTESDVAEWVRQRGIPLSTADPAAPADKLVKLGEWVGDATVVGIGPSTYGGHEQFTMTHRIIRLLVEEHGFRAVATEDDWDVVLDLDRYVRTGEGDLEALLKGAGVPWRARELADAVEWIREYNTTHDEQVRLVGAGVIDTRAAVYEEVTRYVERVAPDRRAALRSHFDVIEPRTEQPVPHFIMQVTDKDAWVEHARSALALVEALPHAEGDGADAREHALVVQHVRQIVAFYEHYAYHLVDDGYRDLKMAENLRWWHEHTGDKIVYWSTNAHSVRSAELTISVPPRGVLTFRPTGDHLREWFGDGYFSLGVTFESGDVNSGWGLPPFASRAMPVPKQAPEFVERHFANNGTPRYLLSLRHNVPEAVREWLATPLEKARVIGSICDPGQDPDGYWMTGGSLAGWYDALIHVKELTPTTIL
ncbi:erythromycin esterase family protein [Actinophytocola sp.]|jgi:erythromycin esterase|uniref:erythromycin esterase family protein n=1 Tax=Actinophytocola sp. TaxID=1872138 RepID=UPI002ED8DDE7